MKKQIGIFSGSFNPIHIGHVALASYMAQYTSLDEVWFLVSPHNPLKDKSELLDEQTRLQMVALALAEYPNLIASDFEFSLPKPSYTIHTLDTLSRKYPDSNFTLIIGGDNWRDFHHWKEYERLRSEYNLLIYPRRGEEVIIDEQYRHNVMLCQAPIIEVSSTFIREGIAEGKNMRAFVPCGVYDFIEENALYR